MISVVVMFVLKWQICILLLCGSIVSGVLWLISERKKDAVESLRSEQKTKLERLTTMSFQSDPNTYRRLAADFHLANNKYDNSESSANLVYALWQSIWRLYTFFFVCSVLFFTIYALANAESEHPKDNSSFKNATFYVSDWVFFWYLAYAIFYGSRLSDQEARSNLKAQRQAIQRLFTAIKLQPFCKKIQVVELIESQIAETPKELEQSDAKMSFYSAKSQQQVAKFKNSTVFVNKNSRLQLPCLRPDEPVPVFEIIKKIWGKDITKISLPVDMNEPMSAMQRNCDAMGGVHPIFS